MALSSSLHGERGGLSGCMGLERVGGRVVWSYGSEGLHEMRVMRGRVVWSYVSNT